VVVWPFFPFRVAEGGLSSIPTTTSLSFLARDSLESLRFVNGSPRSLPPHEFH
jgi:hypothetical protein